MLFLELKYRGLLKKYVSSLIRARIFDGVPKFLPEFDFHICPG